MRGEQFAVWVTIPEGYTAREIAQALGSRALGDASAYERIFLRSGGITVAGSRTPNLEGYLFPSTYLLPTDDSPSQIARVLVDQFRQELPRDAAAQARALHRTIPEVVTIASLIEREGKADDERPLIASVIYNRLRLGMPLEVDASIEYTFPEHHDVITKRDLESDSPYNTYRHTGLPPTPIANPGKTLARRRVPAGAQRLSVLRRQRRRPPRVREDAARAQRERVPLPQIRSIVIETNGSAGASGNGTGGEKQPLDLKDVLELHMEDGTALRFEVVGLVEDDEGNAYAVCYNDQSDEFVVTDAVGDLLDDEDLAQEILDDFFVLAEESAPPEEQKP